MIHLLRCAGEENQAEEIKTLYSTVSMLPTSG
jgi:hypothetical protein